jgi:hypothetical protein
MLDSRPSSFGKGYLSLGVMYVSQRMLDRYSHIRMEAKGSALQARSSKGNDTIDDTKSGHDQPLSSQVIDSIGRRVGT